MEGPVLRLDRLDVTAGSLVVGEKDCRVREGGPGRGVTLVEIRLCRDRTLPHSVSETTPDSEADVKEWITSTGRRGLYRPPSSLTCVSVCPPSHGPVGPNGTKVVLQSPTRKVSLLGLFGPVSTPET